uniref:Uncharacterized protein n=1 Tax=Melanopsichium pennsylvanicum 4 TaxID=1398559 RepID=A0A077R248_9BASI|nr:uncharacterized protein BN887_06007 [Melanopsichium pennsylvanicum 4]
MYLHQLKQKRKGAEGERGAGKDADEHAKHLYTLIVSVTPMHWDENLQASK